MPAEFFDVEGIPVSLGLVPGASLGSAAWDTEPPRPFDPGSARRNGDWITEEAFWKLVASVRAERAQASSKIARGESHKTSAEFFDVEGMPVSLGEVEGSLRYSSAWDTDPPRPFDPSSASRNGARISEAAFWNLVASARKERAERDRS